MEVTLGQMVDIPGLGLSTVIDIYRHQCFECFLIMVDCQGKTYMLYSDELEAKPEDPVEDSPEDNIPFQPAAEPRQITTEEQRARTRAQATRWRNTNREKYREYHKRYYHEKRKARGGQ